jgi:hypothetical protein
VAIIELDSVADAPWATAVPARVRRPEDAPTLRPDIAEWLDRYCEVEGISDRRPRWRRLLRP